MLSILVRICAINTDFFVSAVITGHAEGAYLRSAVLSALRNVQVLEASVAHSGEVILILDSPTAKTLEVANEFRSDLTVYEVAFRDVSKVRNFASQVASGKHLAFLDGDDIWSRNWLVKCFEFVRTLDSSKDFLLHCELNYFFGPQTNHALTLFEHLSVDDERFNVFDLATSNFWTALSFGPIDVFRRIPYVSSSITNSIGFEDWTFNIQAVEAGIKHWVVPETVHFLREKSTGSRRKEESGYGLFHAPSRLWMTDESGSHFS